jgi:HD-GYP domain-containing protein (c-di-GMP phosphodiesterase class II)
MMATKPDSPASNFGEGDSHLYLAIDARMLVPDAKLPFDVYFRHGGMITSLFLKGTLYTGKARNIILSKGIINLYIRTDEKEKFEEYLASEGRLRTPVTAMSLQTPPIFDLDDFFQIDRNALAPYSEIPFDLYILDRQDLRLLIEASEKYPVRLDDMLLAAKGDILIDKNDIPLYRQYLKKYTVEMKEMFDRTNLRVKATLLRENSKMLVKEAVEHPERTEIMKTSGEEVNSVIDAIMYNRDILYHLIDIQHFDYYTYTHSVNVAILSIGLGINTGMNRDVVERLGIGALLHDIGKGAIKSSILNKREILSESEFEIMKTHVSEGEKLLKMHADVTPETLMALSEHHEKLSGSGYPLGLSGKNISLHGRIVSIVDSYDALITNRPYRAAFTPFYALSSLTQEKADYDHDLLRTFVEMLGRVR